MDPTLNADQVDQIHHVLVSPATLVLHQIVDQSVSSTPIARHNNLVLTTNAGTHVQVHVVLTPNAGLSVTPSVVSAPLGLLEILSYSVFLKNVRYLTFWLWVKFLPWHNIKYIFPFCRRDWKPMRTIPMRCQCRLHTTKRCWSLHLCWWLPGESLWRLPTRVCLVFWLSDRQSLY